MANETIRLFFPLKIITYPQCEYGLDDNPEDITSKEAVEYEDAILAITCAYRTKPSLPPRHSFSNVYE